MDIYLSAKHFVLEYYKLCNLLPQDERFGMISQIRRAALSVHSNIAQGGSRKSEAERKKFYEVARGSISEIFAALDIATERYYLDEKHVQSLGG